MIHFIQLYCTFEGFLGPIDPLCHSMKKFFVKKRHWNILLCIVNDECYVVFFPKSNHAYAQVNTFFGRSTITFIFFLQSVVSPVKFLGGNIKK